MKRGEQIQKMFQDPQTRQMNWLKMFRKKKNPRRTNYSPFFSAKVQNLTVFSFIYMIRIRFFGPGELNQKGFRAARYKRCTCPHHWSVFCLRLGLALYKADICLTLLTMNCHPFVLSQHLFPKPPLQTDDDSREYL